MARLAVSQQTRAVPLAVAAALLLTGKQGPVSLASVCTHVSRCVDRPNSLILLLILTSCRLGPPVLAKRRQQLAACVNRRRHSGARGQHHRLEW